MTTVSMPTAAEVGKLAADILRRMQEHPAHKRLVTSSMKYSTCWATFTGYPVIAFWNLDRDAAPLLDEALKVLALKAAVFSLTGGNEQAAKLLVPSPIDEMVHAVLAQFTVMCDIQIDLEIRFPHATELERFDYTHGCATDDYYAAAGWGEQPGRYWLDAAEVNRRLGILNAHYRDAGIHPFGRSHSHGFELTHA